MIHIATVHWQSDKWIDIQLSQLQRFLSGPIRTYAFLNGISAPFYSRFDYVSDEPIEDHGIKLNLLADIIAAQANENDIILFLDGDAFPVAPCRSFLDSTLSVYPLTAVVRRENLSDRQPHPCFCATTVKTWKQIKGDWKKGYTWRDKQGNLVSDIGGNLLRQLELHDISWLPLYRSHSLSPHPLWYGIYNGLIYHHGAGFRSPYSRTDHSVHSYWQNFLQLAASKSRSLHFLLNRLLEQTLEKEVGQRQLSTHDQVYSLIRKNSNYLPELIKNAKES